MLLCGRGDQSGAASCYLNLCLTRIIPVTIKNAKKEDNATTLASRMYRFKSVVEDHRRYLVSAPSMINIGVHTRKSFNNPKRVGGSELGALALRASFLCSR